MELVDIRGVGASTKEKLNLLGIDNIQSLFDFLPSSYIDMDAPSDISYASEGSFVLLELTATKVSKPFSKGKLKMFSVFSEDAQGRKVKLIFFNAVFASKFFEVGKVFRAFGKIRKEKGYEIINPQYENIDNETKFSGIKPIYPLKGKIKQQAFWDIVKRAKDSFSPTSIIEDNTSSSCLELKDAYLKLHFPENFENIKEAKERILLERSVMGIASFRLIRDGQTSMNGYCKVTEIDNLIASLPFELSQSQSETFVGLQSILLNKKPLNAMLSGDVGSGKTIVALLLSFFAVKNGYQTAFMCPTEILAIQHYNTFKKYLEPFGVNIKLFTGSISVKEKNQLKSDLSAGNIDIALGTHSVISKGVIFKNLGLAVIDEQHRFGVSERNQLTKKGQSVDVLTLSATPIPRSLRLCMYGDVDVFSIDNRHSSDNIITKVVPPHKNDDMLSFIVDRCEKGEKAFIVAPKIFDAEGVETDSVEKLFNLIKKKYEKNDIAAFLHGKMTKEEKENTMNSFTNGDKKVLVSTSVIEVGVDVPEASVIAIFSAERFGLASLHQLRGRVGRNGKRAYAFLCSEKESEEEIVRLRALEKERNGLKIAEIDYEIRGAGAWLGENQSGKNYFSPPIHIIEKARKLSEKVDTAKHKESLLQFAERLILERINFN